MALSNIFREPRREITETVVGIAATGAFCVLDYWLAVWIQVTDPKGPDDMPIALAMLAGMIAIVGVLVGAVFIHGVGTFICNELQARGIHLRPRQRR